MTLPGRWIWGRTSGNCPWNTEGPPHNPRALLFLGSLSTPSSQQAAPSLGTHRDLGSSVCFHWGFITLSGPWLRPGLELPALQINPVIHPGIFGFRAGRLWHQPRAAPARLPWTMDGSTKPFGSPSCQARRLGSCGGTDGVPWGPAGLVLGWVWVFGSSRCAPVHTRPHLGWLETAQL